MAVLDEFEPAPIEFLHARIIAIFHEWKRSKTNDDSVEINGVELNNLIVSAKVETYNKYQSKDLQRPIPKTEM